MEGKKLALLFDYDSMIYKASYRVASISDIRKWFKAGKTKEWMRNEIVELSINRLSNMKDALFEEVEKTGVTIGNIFYYMTLCNKSFRKSISDIYKIQRVRNKWVSLVRRRLLDMSFAIVSEYYEADDLVARDHKKLGHGNCIVVSMDKDLKQLQGIHFDYYRPPSNELDERGFKIQRPFRGLSYISKVEAEQFFWKQMLTGDAGDNIKGIKGIGPKKSDRIIFNTEPENYRRVVLEKYVSTFGEEEGKLKFNLAYDLLKLGIKPEYEDDAQQIEDFMY